MHECRLAGGAAPEAAVAGLARPPRSHLPTCMHTYIHAFSRRALLPKAFGPSPGALSATLHPCICLPASTYMHTIYPPTFIVSKYVRRPCRRWPSV